MTIEHKNGEMIVTHPSGHVDKYSEADLISNRDQLQNQIADLNGQLIAQNLAISETQNSLGS